jgi:hypothetical protein
MLTISKPLPVKFICGFIYSLEDCYQKALDILIKKYGEVDFQSDPIIFDFTDYYQNEMGPKLWRRFVSFKRLRNASSYANIKLHCVSIEKKFSQNNKRRINIDPGYLNEAKVALTTTKDFSHRIYLGRGIFAEVTLYFKKGSFCQLPWTFPDYRTPAYQDIFSAIRHLYRENIKSRR